MVKKLRFWFDMPSLNQLIISKQFSDIDNGRRGRGRCFQLADGGAVQMGAKPIPCSHGQYHQDKKDGFITRLTLLMMTILAGMNRMIEILFLLWIFVIEKVGDNIIGPRSDHSLPMSVTNSQT